MTPFEHLGLLKAQIDWRSPELAAFLPPGAEILNVIRRGGGANRHIVWSFYSDAYEWLDGPDAGGQLGVDAPQAVEQVQRALLPG